MSSLPQPLVAYPNPTSARTSSHSKGSFGPVFIVLAVITVVAIIACIIGRLCSRRLCNPKPPSGRAQVNNDVEQAFGESMPVGKPAGYVGPKGEAKFTGHATKKHRDARGAKVSFNFPGAEDGAKTSK